MLPATMVYSLFFFSGLSALIYQILWVRSFSLIFGGSHMAVSTVLAVFMGGLALGGYLGRHLERSSRPLLIYGLLEIGIACSAVLLLGLFQFYPNFYIAYAQLVDNQLLWLTVGRVIFAVGAMILPTTMMGLTLPALAGFTSRQAGNLGHHLAMLYGINTFGAVVGAVAAGFFLLRYLTMAMTYGLAIALSLLVGLISLLLASRVDGETVTSSENVSIIETSPVPQRSVLQDKSPVSASLILFGIAISGFCALGYEVLWTRVLSIVVGTTVYSYTLMLVAFLIGISAGGAIYRPVRKFLALNNSKLGRSVLTFGIVQILIGLLAAIVSYALRDLPNQALAVEALFQQWQQTGTGTRQATNFALALTYMLVPAFFMGIAFPLAGDIVARTRKTVSKSVGETLSYNTVGAILGASVSGFALIYFFGIERSLQFLSLMNLGLGLSVCTSLLRFRSLTWGAAIMTLIVIVLLQTYPNVLRFWDMKYFAIYNHNARQVLASESARSEILNNTEVLYYAEGMTSTVSVIKVKGVNQGLHVNGRTVASSARQDQQCQYTLGHLPMLLHPNPRKVWVLGMGTGMTAGATAVHPEVETVTIVELEKHVLPAARTFSDYNHDLLDHPKVDIVFNDGRNFLLTTDERYDVITADPIHPWSQGAAYLYTDEYYSLAASRLRPGGVMCQWLPIYELSSLDLQSVVKTFGNNFRYVYIWLTDYDAELIGSNEPINIDTDTLQQRIEASPEVLADLRKVDMGSAAEFLSYCVMGPKASLAYGKDAPLNTDNNLYLEFSAPQSKGKWRLVAANIASLASHREDISPYLEGPSLASALGTDKASMSRAIEFYDKAHRMHYLGQDSTSEYNLLMSTMERWFPWYAPGQFLLKEYTAYQDRQPRLYKEIELALRNEEGTPESVTLSLVTMKIGPERAKLMIVDNSIRKIYSFFYVEAESEVIDQQVASQADEILSTIHRVYQTAKSKTTTPNASVILPKILAAIESN